MAAQTHRTYCRICPVQCGLSVAVEGNRVLSVEGDPDHPLSRGYACVKGRALGRLHHHADRLDAPLLGEDEVSWEALLDDLAPRLQGILETFGPDAIGFYQGTWSWMDVLGRRSAERLARALGTRSIYSAVTVDAVSRSYVAEQMTGRAFLVPNLDLEQTDLLLVVGMNLLVSHGHSCAVAKPAERLRGVRERGALWVVDPRRSETARMATEHLAPRPGSDYALLACLVRELLAAGGDDASLAERATGVDALAEAVAPFTPEHASALCGVPADAILRLAGAIRRTPRFAVATGTGVTMAPHGAVTDWLAWCLQIVAGSFDAPGGVWFNPGQLLRLDERDWSPQWDGAVERVPSRADLPARFGERPCAGLVDEIEAGHLRALFVIGGNPVASLPEAERLVPALRSLDALVVADILPADTQRLATHTFAVAGQLERADTTQYADLFAGQRSAQYTPAVVPIGADRRPTWWAFAQLARRMGFDLLDGADPDAQSDRGLLETASRGRFEVGDAPQVVVADERRPRGWVAQRVLPDGRWRLAPPDLLAQLSAATPPAQPCFVPRRAVGRMNSALRDLQVRDEEVLLHPDDAAAAGVAQAARVRIESATGTLEAPLRVTDEVAPGVVSIPHGLDPANVSRLTTGRPGAVESASGMVRQSGIPVTIQPVVGDSLDSV